MTEVFHSDIDLPRFEGAKVVPQARRVDRALPPLAGVEGNRDQHRLNERLAIALVAIVATAPIPLASNRPAFWTIWAVIVGFVGLLYGARLLMLGASARTPLRRYWFEAVLVALLLVFLAVQLLPVGRWFGLSLPLQDGSLLGVNTLTLDPGSTTLQITVLITYALLFYLFVQVAANRRRARRLLMTLFVIVAAYALFGLVNLTNLGDTLLGLEKQFYEGSATATFVNRNSFATFLACGLVVGVALLIQVVADKEAESWVGRASTGGLVGLGMLFIASALLATGSRMGTAAGLAGVLVVLAVAAVALRGGARARILLVLGGAVIVSVAALVLFGTGLVERYIFTDDGAGRGELYRQVWEAISTRPWTGFGGGSFAAVFPAFQHAPLAGDVVWDRAHSTYLALWFELGLVAGSLPLLLIAALAVRTISRLADESSVVLSLATLGVIVVFALHSTVDFSAEIEANAFLFTALLALGTSGSSLRNSGKSDR